MSVGTLAGTAWVNVLPKMDAFQASVSKGLKGLETQTAAAGKSLTKHLTLPLVAVAAVSIKLAVDFDTSMSRIKGLVGASTAQMGQYRQAILDMSPAVGQGPKALADALFFVTSAGLKGKAALDVLRESAKGASSGLGDTKTVADAVTSAVNAYGAANLSASKAVDILSATVKSGKTAASAVAPVLGSLLPLSQRLGVSFGQVGASIASMTRIGINAPAAATALRGFYTSILNVSPKVTAALKKVGLSQKGLLDELKNPRQGLPVVLTQLDKAFGGNVLAMRKAFPNIRGMSGLMALTGKNTKTTLGIFKDLAHATGQNEKAFRAFEATPEAKFDKLKNSLKVLAITLGDQLLPYVLKFVAYLSKLVKKYQELSPHTQTLIKQAILLAAVLGPGLTIFSKLIKVILFVGRAIGFTVKAVTLLGRALLFLFANPVGLVVLGIAALVVGLILLYKHSETFRSIVTAAFKTVAAVVGFVVGFITQHWRLLAIILYGVVGVAIVLIIDHFHAITRTVASVIRFVIQHWRIFLVIFTGGLGLAIVLVVNHFRSIIRVVSSVVSFIISHWRSLVSMIPGIGTAIVYVVDHFGALKKTAGQVIDAVAGFVSSLGGDFDWLAGKLQPVIGKLQWILDKAGSAASAVGKVLSAGDSVLKHLAGGGTLSAGEPAIVGEVGPELFIPNTAGRIVPNHHMAAAMGGGGSGRASLTITNWRDGTGYFQAVADSSVNRAGALRAQRRRMSR